MEEMHLRASAAMRNVGGRREGLVNESRGETGGGVLLVKV